MVDGKHVPKPEVLKGFKDDWNNYTKTTGIRKWTWFIKAGKGSDGTVYDLASKYERSEIDKMAIKNLSDSVWNTDTYDNLGPQGGTPEALISQKVSDTMTQNITKAIIAKTPEEAGQSVRQDAGRHEIGWQREGRKNHQRQLPDTTGTLEIIIMTEEVGRTRPASFSRIVTGGEEE